MMIFANSTNDDLGNYLAGQQWGSESVRYYFQL